MPRPIEDVDKDVSELKLKTDRYDMEIEELKKYKKNLDIFISIIKRKIGRLR